jgi:serine/threonine-protein kinase
VFTTDALTTALSDRYAIERLIGEGGMAKVYLARDLRHNRRVALKVLRPDLGAVVGVERFQAEIETTANLQHPNLLPLFDSGVAGELLYYVMPYIEGESLRARLDREKQLPVDETIRIATAIAAALDYAHRHNVIHRDLKPENILMQEGQPVVADFGIALAIANAGGTRITQTGLSLGTPQYMSPEQATGDRVIDARTDIYSLGALTYEMLVGEPPHSGGTAQAIIARVLTEHPRPMRLTRPAIPEGIEGAVMQCLEKVPADRWTSAREFGEALQGRQTARYAISPSRPRIGTNRLTWIVGVVAALALAIAAWSVFRPAPRPAVLRLDLTLPAPVSGNDVTISPDGTTLTYSGQVGGATGIFVRHLDADPDFRMLPGTEGGAHPAFSPDSKWIVFHRESDGAVIRMSANGGGLTTLFTDINAHNPHWGTADKIVFTGPAGNFIVSATGGGRKTLRGLVGRRIFLLPDGSGVLGQFTNSSVGFYDLKTDSVTELIKSARLPVYVVPGYILYDDDLGGASAVRFDLKRRRVIGAPVRVLDRVNSNVSARAFSVADNGTLLQREGEGRNRSGATLLVIRSIDGSKADTLPLKGSRRVNPRFSPNGRYLLYADHIGGLTGADIFVFDLVTGTNTQLTFNGINSWPQWSPDGTEIAYETDSSGAGGSLRIKRADNSGPERTLLTLENGAAARPNSWPRPDLLLFTRFGSKPPELATISPAAGSSPKPYLTAPWQEIDPALSPDGHLAAFSAHEGMFDEIWIRDFPTPVGKWKVSTQRANASSPRWTADGRYVYYWIIASRDSLWRARIDRTPSIVVHAPELVGDFDVSGGGPIDFHPDGKRYIIAANDAPVVTATDGSAAKAIRYIVILNWKTELEALMKAAPH